MPLSDVAQADESLQSGSLAVAIQQYQQAANADPTNPSIRVKLADAFARKGMYAQANAALSRAALLGAAADQIDAARTQIDAMQAGKRTSKVEPVRADPTAASSASAAVSQPNTPATAATTTSAVSQILTGDKLWRQNKPDEAADAYREAIKLSPSDWRAYERLALVDASVSMFADSRAAIEQLSKVQPHPSSDIIARRYQLLSSIATQWFATLFKQYDDDAADYAKHTITRESYYASIKGLSGRLESMAKFLDALDVPKDRQAANLHRSLACGLVSQAASSLQDYLETNNKESKSSAETFVAQAKKELDTVKSLEGNRAVVQKQPTTSQPSTPQPAVDNSGANTSTQPQPDTSVQDNSSPPPPGPPAVDNSGPDMNSPSPPGPPPPDAGPNMDAPAPPPPGVGGDAAPAQDNGQL